MSKKNSGPYLEIMDWNDECKRDFLTGKGFEIKEPTMSKKAQKDRILDGQKDINSENGKAKYQKSLYGIWSTKYCYDWRDENAFEERYSCLCGEMRGKIYEGEICPTCKTKIVYKDVDLEITGWMLLGDYSVIHPVYYNKLISAIGKKAFPDIIKYDKKINRDGHIEDKEKLSGPYSGIGIVEFKEKFDEIIEYYKKKKKNKIDQIEDIEEGRNKIFVSAIPVYSSVLRAAGMKGESLFYSKIDRLYSSMFSLVDKLKDSARSEKKKRSWMETNKERMDTKVILSDIQDRLMEVYSEIFSNIDQKEGHIKDELLGGIN